MSSGTGGQPAGPLDKLFADTGTPILVVFALCCGQIAFILSLICLLTAKIPEAKKKALTTLLITVVAQVVLVVLYFVLVMGGLLAGAAGQ